MIVYGVYMWRVDTGADGKRAAVLLCSSTELSSISFFQRGSAREILLFGNRQVVASLFSATTTPSREIVRITPAGSYSCHFTPTTSQALPGVLLACTVTTDGEYPGRVAFSLAAKACETFLRCVSAGVAQTTQQAVTVGEWEELLRRYQDPTSADPVSRIQKEVEETRAVLVETMDQLLQRGQKLDKLVEDSNDLSFQSKVFLKQSKDLNSCSCTLL